MFITYPRPIKPIARNNNYILYYTRDINNVHIFDHIVSLDMMCKNPKTVKSYRSLYYLNMPLRMYMYD